MPAFSFGATALSTGDKLAVLNAENLASGGLTAPVVFTPQPTPVTLAIVNASSVTVSLVASADNKSDGSTYFPVYAGETAITVATDTVGVFSVAFGLFYAVKAGGSITAGTIWLAR